MNRRRLPLVVTLLALAVPASAQARVAADALPARPAKACPNQDLVPAPGNLAAIRAAILCLHNQVRAAHHLPPLRADRKLARAATGHSADMVASGYFEHTSPSGSTMVGRITRAGYPRRGHGWMLGENILWGTGGLGTPRGAMRGWMHSPPHRANILRPGYRQLGVGVAVGTPESRREAGATYTVDFGTIR